MPASEAGKRTDGKRAGDTRKETFSLPGSHSSGPIHIDANLLEFDARADVATFRGNVVTTQDDIVMHSAVLRVTFVPAEGIANLDRVQTVIAEGAVHITQGNRVARGERAEFDDAARTLVLSGGAVLVEGASEVRGERVIVYLDEERSVVEGTNSRVKAVLVPHGEDGGGARAASGGKSPGTPDGQGQPDRPRKRGNAGPSGPIDAATRPGPGTAGVAPGSTDAATPPDTALGDTGAALDDDFDDEGSAE